MRTLLIWSDTLTSPEPRAVPAPPPPLELPARPDAIPTFDPDSGLQLDESTGTVHLIARVGREAFDGTLVAPESIVVRVFDPSDPASDGATPMAEGRRPVMGPGPIAVGVDGLVPGAVYRFDLIAEYPD